MKRIYSIVLLFIATISLVACTNKVTLDDEAGVFREDLPTLKVVAENDSIHAEQGTASWTIENNDGTESAIEIDTAGPKDLVKDMDQLSASPESRLQLNFSNDPQEIIVNLWEEKEQLKQDSTDMEIILPDLEGLLIYEVIATWEQGTVHYAFSVDLE